MSSSRARERCGGGLLTTVTVVAMTSTTMATVTATLTTTTMKVAAQIGGEERLGHNDNNQKERSLSSPFFPSIPLSFSLDLGVWVMVQFT